MKTKRRALISVSDKTGLIPLAKALNKHGVQLLSTGGTLKALKAAKISAIPVDEATGFPEILEGRVKTLHPKIHGGLLFRRDKRSHVQEAQKHGIEPIDFVIVNLYPFEKVTKDEKIKLEVAIENIDIGGPSMLRSAAKNYDAVTVVCDPNDYDRVISELTVGKGKTSLEFRKQLALKVFERTAAYDLAIAGFLNCYHAKGKSAGEMPELPQKLTYSFDKVQDLRYGENPHQKASFYVPSTNEQTFPFRQLHGKELSFNNFLDIEGALDVIREFDEPAACVVKHSNPCGVAQNEDIVKALELAIECDAMSAFGGIVAMNQPCTLKAAQLVLDKLGFFEVFIAPSFDKKAVELMRARKNLRLIETGDFAIGELYDRRFVQGGLLVQERDRPLRLNEGNKTLSLKKNIKVVTKTKLAGITMEDLIFAFKCVKSVKSNAIVITQGCQSVGIGAGQMSRVDAVEIACRKAGYRTDGGILASDAFFPMPDSIEAAHEHKIKAIIQPGGSIRDKDVIAACDDYGIAMAVVGQRHFRH